MPENNKDTKVKDMLAALELDREPAFDALFVLLYEMAIERSKYGTYASRIEIAGLSSDDIKRRVARMDFAREILNLLDEKQRARIAPKIIK